MKKKIPSFFGLKITNLRVFFLFEEKRLFGPQLHGLWQGGMGWVFMLFGKFSAIYVVTLFLVALVTLCIPCWRSGTGDVVSVHLW